jgi:hypothetical protein
MRRSNSRRSRLLSGFSITGTRDGGYPSSSQPSLHQSSSPFFIRAQVNNTHHIAILDTGSSITIIHNRFLRTIQHHTFTPSSKSYSSANCTRIEIVGEVLLEIKINNIRTSIKASVASHLVTDLLLGADWIDRHVISIHPLSRTILVQDENGRSTTVPIIRPTDSSCSSVTLVHRTTIPAYSESAVAVHIPRSGRSDVVFEPLSTFHRKSVLMQPSLLHVNRNRSQVVLHNNTDRAFTLSRNTRLGTVSPYPVICGTSLPSTSDSTNLSPHAMHQCYVCHQRFISNNDLYRHLREQRYPQELRENLDALTAHILDSSARTKIQNVLWRHAKLFDTSKPSKINITLENAIDTGTHRPVHTAPYRRSPTDHAAIADEAAIRLKHEHIEPSISPWCSPVVLVRKKDGTTRFCVDYRKLNEITTKDSFPLPRLDDIFDQISGSNYFTKLDFKNGYFQVPLASEDRPKTAFSTRDNHYQFTILPQGIKNGPPTFQRIVNQILGPTRWKHCVAYIDDVLIFSKTFAEHITHLNEVLQLLADANFRLRVSF